MNVVVNGELRRIDESITLVGLIHQLELEGKRLAIEVNEEVVPRSEHARYRLREGDKVEIVQAIGGG
ncbi:MAG: sulfur carrier protein ThiS [Gammaproteobacteria bacterium]|nr:sulfur carrier protein ThiS [Gammaproteobacteria bacterium]